jgi:hypothetical protein
MSVSTAGGSAPSGCTVGGRLINNGGRLGRSLSRARRPLWQRDPRLDRNHDFQAVMVAVPSPLRNTCRRCHCCANQHCQFGIVQVLSRLIKTSMRGGRGRCGRGIGDKNATARPNGNMLTPFYAKSPCRAVPLQGRIRRPPSALRGPWLGVHVPCCRPGTVVPARALPHRAGPHGV